MDLINYYKTHLYEYAYNKGYDDGISSDRTPNPAGDQSDIYWQDEMDYYLIADYLSLFCGGIEDVSKEDENFIKGLGFELTDFFGDEK